MDLGPVRARRHVDRWREKISGVIDLNRRTFERLYDTGVLFSDDGARAGRDLLRAHQHLLEVSSVLDRIEKTATKPGGTGGKGDALGSLYRELDGLLDRTQALTHRTGAHVARMRRCRSTAE